MRSVEYSVDAISILLARSFYFIFSMPAVALIFPSDSLSLVHSGTSSSWP
jgi:hypothetical protein